MWKQIVGCIYLTFCRLSKVLETEIMTERQTLFESLRPKNIKKHRTNTVTPLYS